MARGDLDIQPSPYIGRIRAYRPPVPAGQVDLRLDGNEGQLPAAALESGFSEAHAELMRRYPDAAPLERQIAEMLGLRAEQVVLTSGADDALERAIRAVLAPGREMILPVPTFDMFGHFAGLTGCTQVLLPWQGGPFPVEEMLASVSERTALLVVVTPNNPTGLSVTARELEAISRGAPDRLLLVDLAYTEFADEDLTACAVSLPNAVVVRSMSKAWGLAGLRVGWASGPANVIEWMRIVGRPYPVSSIAIKVASDCLLNGREDVERFAAVVRGQRERLASLLEHRGARPVPSQTNFVLSEFDDPAWVYDALCGMGIGVRAFPNKRYLERSLRIALPGEEAAFTRLCRAIDTVLAPEALLFDIDDTLADVTSSYRLATVATAAAFGAEVSLEEITEAKAAGDANNDWVLTWRLLDKRGIAAPLEEVTRRFEQFYQGTAGTPGMCESETLLVPREALERMARRVKLGIVTGRPRKDAVRFLEKHGIAGLFGAVVTMDDGPLKPDPAPVRRAMAALGAERAWMVGDTPDDIRSARTAGALPIGVVAPADDPGTARAALTRSGAARVLGNASEIEELLP